MNSWKCYLLTSSDQNSSSIWNPNLNKFLILMARDEFLFNKILFKFNWCGNYIQNLEAPPQNFRRCS